MDSGTRKPRESALLLARERTASFHDWHKLIQYPETCEKCRESGYGLLFRTVASTLTESDPGAAQALERAAVDVEQMASTLRLCREVVERYGNYWCKDDAYYAVSEALGIEEPPDPSDVEPEHSDPHGPRHQ